MYNEDGSLNLNPNSLTVLDNCVVEPELMNAKLMTASSLSEMVSSALIARIQRMDSLYLTESSH